ncbi:DMT family transporter [[Clostridium] symbiosum]|uniref:DMT family transporter n=1 Tax=Clostridium symbiosum TaxID=1512 RepID=UPI001FABBDA3|nr:DMT family transporter [[Clostridium] symbiosum]MDB2030489.1 DMT family transporter [[Clostridium] symbiosum]
MMKKDIRMMKAVAAAVLGNSFFGLSFLFSKVALERLEPFVLLAVRFIVAFVMLNLVLLTGKVKIRLTGKPVQKILMLGLVQPVLYFTFENYGIRGTSTAFAGTLLAIVPVITLIAGVLFKKEIPSRLQVFGAVLSMIGVAVISLAQQRGSNEAGGVAFLFCAVVSSVGYNLLMRDTADSFTSFERTYVMLGLGSLFFTCFSVIQSGGALGRLLQPLSGPGVWGSIFYLAAFSSVGAFFLLNYAFSYLNLAQASIFTNLVTVVSIAAGIVFLGESFNALQGIGSIAILTGVYLSNHIKGRTE